jgi:hypothetical protein
VIEISGYSVECMLLCDFAQWNIVLHRALHHEDASQDAVEMYGYEFLGDKEGRLSTDVLGFKQLLGQLEEFLLLPS